MKRKLLYVFAVPVLFSMLAFQGNCHSQCEELRRELRAECKEDLGANSERCRVDQQRFQEACHQEFEEEPSN
jgi:hypothetical protein